MPGGRHCHYYKTLEADQTFAKNVNPVFWQNEIGPHRKVPRASLINFCRVLIPVSGAVYLFSSDDTFFCKDIAHTESTKAHTYTHASYTHQRTGTYSRKKG